MNWFLFSLIEEQNNKYKFPRPASALLTFGQENSLLWELP